jgi:hypothetical protein
MNASRPSRAKHDLTAAFATAGSFGLICLSTHGAAQAVVARLQAAAAARGRDAGGVSIAAPLASLSHLK